jgi:ribosomal protein S26
LRMAVSSLLFIDCLLFVYSNPCGQYCINCAVFTRVDIHP